MDFKSVGLGSHPWEVLIYEGNRKVLHSIAQI